MPSAALDVSMCHSHSHVPQCITNSERDDDWVQERENAPCTFSPKDGAI